MRLMRSHKETIRKALLEQTFGPRRKVLAQEDNDLALDAIRHQFGADVFFKIQQLPEGWLPMVGRVYLESKHKNKHRRECKLIEWRSLPNIVAIGRSIEIDEELTARLHGLEKNYRDLADQQDRASRDIDAALASFGTIKQLESEWPEARALLKIQEPVKNLPIIRVDEVMNRLAAMKEVA